MSQQTTQLTQTLEALAEMLEGKQFDAASLEDKKSMNKAVQDFIAAYEHSPLQVYILLKRLADASDTMKKAVFEEADKELQKLLAESENKTTTIGPNKVSRAFTPEYDFPATKKSKKCEKEIAKIEKEVQPLKNKLERYQQEVKSLKDQIAAEQQEMLKNGDPLVKRKPDNEQPKPQIRISY